MNELLIAAEDPRGAADIEQILEAHLALMRRISPPGHVHALDLERLATPEITFLAARSGTRLLGVGALKELGDGRAEIKSMHTTESARGLGVGRRLVDDLLAIAIGRGVTWLGLETGTQPEFEPARALYASFGFTTCEPFDGYTVNPYSTCMSLDLTT